MAGSIVSATSASSSASDNAPTVTKPAGVGVVYVFSIVCADFTVTWPAGFTELAESGNEGSIGNRIRTAVRVYTGSEGATFAATTSGYAAWSARCVLVDGITSTLIDSDSTGNYTGYGTTATLTGNSVSTGGANRFVLWVGASGYGAGEPSSYTPPSGFSLYGSVYVPFATYSPFIGHWTKSEPTSVSGGYSGSATYSGSDSRNGFTATLVFAETGGGGSSIAPISNYYRMMRSAQ
jgi:hypothetical protein